MMKVCVLFLNNLTVLMSVEIFLSRIDRKNRVLVGDYQSRLMLWQGKESFSYNLKCDSLIVACYFIT
jgi:hypothetical protein